MVVLKFSDVQIQIRLRFCMFISINTHLRLKIPSLTTRFFNQLPQIHQTKSEYKIHIGLFYFKMPAMYVVYLIYM